MWQEKDSVLIKATQKEVCALQLFFSKVLGTKKVYLEITQNTL